MPPVTTIKVPKTLHERIAHDASEQGLTLAAFLTSLVDQYERERRMAAVARAYRGGVDEDYIAETATWHESSADGLAND